MNILGNLEINYLLDSQKRSIRVNFTSTSFWKGILASKSQPYYNKAINEMRFSSAYKEIGRQ